MRTIPCPDCNRKFHRDSDLAKHRWDAHGTEHPFGCGQCSKTFTSALNLALHRDAEHGLGMIPINRRPTAAEVDPVCVECGRRGELVDGRSIYPHRPDLHAKRYYLCECGAYCGCHPNSIVPLGFPAGPETRRQRNMLTEPSTRSGAPAKRPEPMPMPGWPRRPASRGIAATSA